MVIFSKKEQLVTTVKSERTFLPAAGHDFFLPIYDPFTKLFGFDKARRVLLDQAALQSHDQVLDVGCGTGTLAVLIKRLYPTVDVVALDPDPKALARAQRKAERAAVSIRFDRGFSDRLGYQDAAFDRVFSSMMFHHVDKNDKDNTLGEIRRVLKPDGRLEFLDFAGPQAHGHGALGRFIHSHQRLTDNTEDRILGRLSRAGFRDAKKVAERNTFFGAVAYYQATR
jgi:ubiquinone/menaquinone biosynthesis C-methylase UbiE